MATAAIDVPASNRVVPGSHHLAPVAWPKPTETPTPDAGKVAAAWISSFNSLIKGEDVEVSSLFRNDCHWRDLLCLTWDFHSHQGPEKIASAVRQKGKECRLKSISTDTSTELRKPAIAPVDFGGNVKGVQSFLTVDTDVGRGRGLVRLVPDPEDGGKWKAFTFFTVLQELKGFEEFIDARRPTGVAHGAQPGRKNWKERRDAEANFEDGLEPTVLIIGAGQGGLTSAARLKQLGVQTLIVDQNPRIGDNWRNRYHQLVLHDTIWYDHMPYIPFPSNWPIFTPKDKLADWFEFYASAMELNVWTKTTIKDSKWDDDKREWTVELEREKDGKKETRTLHPRHVIQATGHSGEAYFPPNIKGIDDFKGDCLVHSSQFKGPQENGKGKRAVIVGCCNSAHDIAQDYYEHGYDVTMVQRSSTLIVTSKSLFSVLMKGIYDETGPPVEEADMINMSMPSPVLKRFHSDATAEMTRLDTPLLRGLIAAGFAVDNGPDCAGLFMKYLHRGGGYYIDVGTAQLVADKKIKIKQGQEIACLKAHSISFADNSELEADEIVFATGFQNMRETARKIFGNELADRVGDVWGYDDEGETRTMWRRSGHPGFWFFGGNLALCRFYSKLLALQIKALETGVMQYDDA